MQRGKNPFTELGQRLQSIRYHLKESLHEVSGAIELEADMVESYERGEARPSEDVLSLLLNHFDVSDEEADEIWELAGYAPAAEQDMVHDAVHHMPVPNIVVMPIDNKIVYTDSATVSINKHGVVMTFLQSPVVGNQSVPAARIGMSLEHAKSVLDVLSKTITEAGQGAQPKQLPGKTQKDSKKPKKSQ